MEFFSIAITSSSRRRGVHFCSHANAYSPCSPSCADLSQLRCAPRRPEDENGAREVGIDWACGNNEIGGEPYEDGTQDLPPATARRKECNGRREEKCV